MVRIHVVVVLALASLSACDKLAGFGGDGQAQADLTTPAVEPIVEPGNTSPTPTSAESTSGAGEQAVTPEPPTPEPEQAPAAPVSEFDGLLVRVSGLADPKHAAEPTVEQDTKTAWIHYKSKQWSEAAMFFARVAARDPEWKHAHNLACASAKAGKPDDVRIALAESLNRGGDTAKTSANKDSDLAIVRGLPWFAELLAADKPGDPESTIDSESAISESAIPKSPDEEELDADEIPPPNCPPGVKYGDDHYCWHDTIAEWKFEEIVFSTPVVLDLEIPERPKDKRWKRARGKIPWKELRAEFGIQHTIESEDLTEMSHLVEWSVMVWEEFIDEPEDETMPYFWWPEDNTPILVLPHKQKLGKVRFTGVILARKTDAGWRAINLPVTKEAQLDGNGNYTFESGVVLRFDGLELFTLTQFVYRDDPDSEIDERSRFMCRIRWERGKLSRACTETWKETGKTWG